MSQARIIFFFLLSKWRYGIICLSLAVTLFVFLFPIKDLNDFITAQVSFFTGRSVYLEFDEMQVSFIPGVSISLEGLDIEARNLSPLRAQKVSASPSLGGLIGMAFGGEIKPYGVYEAQGFMDGDVRLDISSGEKTENGVEQFDVELNAQDFSLGKISRFAKLPMQMKGTLSLEAKSLVDPTFTEQPDGSMTLNIQRIEIPAASIDSMMGAVPTPSLNLAKIQIAGRINNGRLYIDRGTIGENKDELFGNLKGSIQMNLGLENGRITPRFGAYDFEVDLNMKKSFEEKGQLMLILIEGFKKNTETGSSFKFKMTGQNFMTPPTFRAN